jgi:hypothetical protein
MKRCSTSLVTREMQAKTTRKCYFMALGCFKKKRGGGGRLDLLLKQLPNLPSKCKVLSSSLITEKKKKEK